MTASIIFHQLSRTTPRHALSKLESPQFCHLRISASLPRRCFVSTFRSQSWHPAPNRVSRRLIKSHVHVLQPTRAPFSSSPERPSDPSSDQDAPVMFSDPSRSDLYYHFLTSEPPVFALSFLSSPPPDYNSPSVIGWLPAQTLGEEDEAGLNDFKENRRYRYACVLQLINLTIVLHV
jgi:hypothetical protein